MNSVPLSTLATYELIERSTPLLSRLLSASAHPGKRAQITHRVGPLKKTFDGALAARMLRSQWASRYIQSYVNRATTYQLHRFLDENISYTGDWSLQKIAASERPIIIATPHFGPYLIGCLAAARLLNGQKRMNFFYDHTPRNAGIRQLVSRAGGDTRALIGGFNGIVAAIKGLRNGECLSMLPDVFKSLTDTIVVPFFDRLLRVAPGTAFISVRTDALIIPAYVIPQSRMRVRVHFSAPIDPRLHTHQTESDAIFRLSCHLFADFESQFRQFPEHWEFWGAFLKSSTACSSTSTQAVPNYLAEIRARCAAWPQLEIAVPELKPLLAASTH